MIEMPSLTRSKLDEELGMKFYATHSSGIGGVLRERDEDFIVIEVALGRVLCTPRDVSKLGGGEGEYTWFLLEKRGIDTVTALRAIARALGVSHKRLSVAGLKDAHAVTFQLACVKGVEPCELPKRVGDRVWIHRAFKMPFKLTPGMLYGNAFRIRVRRLEAGSTESEERIQRICAELEEVGGAPNYYGYQRFGTIRPLTHIIGRHVLRGEFEDAVRTLLTRIYPGESPRAKEARRYLASTWDFKGALEIFPRRLHHERAIIHYLVKHPGDYAGAIRTLPLSVRQLFIGAFQAYLFNLVLSKRLEAGLPLSRAVVGDLVALRRDGDLGSILRANESNLDKVNRLIASGRAEVVANVPGYSTTLAEGVPGAIEREVLAEEEVSIDMFRIRHMPELSSRGTVRPVALRPEDMRFEVIATEEGAAALFSFTLRKGMYATVLMREFVKPEDPAAQGF
ncbi:MAG: tRNA pseudouridine(13) synthase TruD [Thermoprotei archaeon]|nr:MAG: tRNA pseudouridine(13) synthase TruD [Thermoprotei archaeon]HDD34106.1 tRNA pseudouridine(13) synthase TruD [Thermofilaceae archaeon]